MKLRQLQIFTAAYREKSISGAARRLGLSQPQVSLAIQALEKEYGLDLTRPEGRGVAFTEAACLSIGATAAICASFCRTVSVPDSKASLRAFPAAGYAP